MNLFLDEPEIHLGAVKVASPLPDNPDEWAQAILELLSKEAPYAMKYAPQVQIIRNDPDTNTAMGMIVLTSASQSAIASTHLGPAAGKRAIVPLVISAGELSPVDLVMTSSGKLWPLTEARLREALFRPQTFDMVTRQSGDDSLQDMFGLDSISGFGSRAMQSPQTLGAGANKFSSLRLSEKFPLLLKAASSATNEDLERVSKDVVEDDNLKLAAANNGSFWEGLRIISLSEGRERHKLASAVAPGNLVADVAQFGTNGSGQYWMKTASRKNFAPAIPIHLTRKELLKIAGEDLAVRVDSEGTVTVAEPCSTSKPVVDENAFSTSSEVGRGYRKLDHNLVDISVRGLDGKDLIGRGFGDLVDFEGVRVPLAVFTNGDITVIQDELVGDFSTFGHSCDSLRPSRPQGFGMFYVSGGVKPSFSIPVTVEGSDVGPEGIRYHVVTCLGEKKMVRLVPGIQKLIQGPDGEAWLPSITQFYPLPEEVDRPLAKSSEDLKKTASIDSASIRIYGDGGRFSYRVNRMSKLASVTPNHLTFDEATMFLCAAGCSAGQAHTFLKKASRGNSVTLYGVQDVDLAHLKAGRSLSKVASISRERSEKIRELRVDLVKEAALIPDSMTVDSALSLRFMNSDNFRMFIKEIPKFEQTINRLGEMLLASRLGMSEIPEYAASRANRSLDSVVQGLKALSLRSVEEEALS